MTEANIPADDFLARKLNVFTTLTHPEYEALSRIQRREIHLGPGSELVVQGGPIERAFVLRDGWAARHKILVDGRRQILSFVLPGDVIGATGAFIRSAEQSVVSLTDVTVAEFKPQRLLTLYRKWPRLAAALGWASAREESILAERVVSLGRRNAREALSHLFLELSHRLQVIGLAGSRAFELPVTQTDLADALGLTVVHVNRTLKRMQRDGVIDLESGIVKILDRERLAETPAFKETYLLHNAPPPATQELLADITVRPKTK